MDVPRILFVDDDDSELLPLSRLINDSGDGQSQVLTPNDVTISDLQRADLVVVDYNLDAWTSQLPIDDIGRNPFNGIALSGVLREHALRSKDYPPTGFALISGKADQLCPVPAEQRPHVVSRLCNFEWFFEKGDGAANVGPVISLASAIRSLPEDIEGLAQSRALLEYLGIDPGERLFERFLSGIEHCRPPIHFLAERSHGLAILRWLLHRILPHKCFLCDSMHLAARLRVTLASLEAAIETESPFATALSRMLYTGPLAAFQKPRWWSDGVEQWLWDETEGNSDDSEAIGALLDRTTAGTERVELRRPVVVLNASLLPDSEFAEYEETVAVHLDDWPSYAEPGYMRRSTVKDSPSLRMYVDTRDRHLV